MGTRRRITPHSSLSLCRSVCIAKAYVFGLGAAGGGDGRVGTQHRHDLLELVDVDLAVAVDVEHLPCDADVLLRDGEQSHEEHVCEARVREWERVREREGSTFAKGDEAVLVLVDEIEDLRNLQILRLCASIEHTTEAETEIDTVTPS